MHGTNDWLSDNQGQGGQPSILPSGMSPHNSKGWIGVDFDGTLVTDEFRRDPDHHGDPIPRMVERVRFWLMKGIEVRIVTGRVGSKASEENIIRNASTIQKFCIKHFGKPLPITCAKDQEMICLWDDRCVQVVTNTGMTLSLVQPTSFVEGITSYEVTS